MKLSHIIYLLCTAIVMFACKNEESESIHPVAIDILKPYKNQSYSMDDSFIVDASFRSQLELISASITMLDENKAEFKVILEEDVNDFFLHANIQIPVKDLGSEYGGDYFLQFYAANLEVSASSLLPINIKRPNDSLYNIFVVSENGSNLKLELYTPSLEPDMEIELNSDYSSSDVSSDLQYLFVSGSSNSGIRYINARDGVVTQEINPGGSSNTPYFSDVVYNNGILYSSTFENGIKGYDILGDEQYNAATPENQYASKIFATENHLHTLLTDENSTTESWGIYYKDQTTLRKQLPLDGTYIDAVGVFEDYMLILFYNDELKYVIAEVHPESDEINILTASHKYAMLGIDQIDFDNYVILCENHILLYEKSTNSIIETSNYNDNNLKKIRCNKVNKNFYAYSNDSLYILTYPTMVIENSLYLQDSALNMHLLYNQ